MIRFVRTIFDAYVGYADQDGRRMIRFVRTIFDAYKAFKDSKFSKL